MAPLGRIVAAGLVALSSLASALYVPPHRIPGRALGSTNSSSPSPSTPPPADEQPLVFSHFMIGIVGARKGPEEYDADMLRAKSVGIDAFALNVGVDPYTDTQLGYAYQSAANNGMKVFISFDFNWYNTSQASDVGKMIAKYGTLDAQLMVDGKVFASSFAGDGLDVAAMRAAAGMPVFFAPNFHPSGESDFSDIDGALNWMAWSSNGKNKAPNAAGNVSVESGDEAYLKALGNNNYIAPVSPWFSTHYGPEVPYSKNFVFPGDLLWHARWNEILALKPRFVEIITWNDYGESHYVGPLDSPHGDDGNSKWTNGMPHDSWLDMARPFIAAFHAGADSADSYVDEDRLVYWYRPTPAGVDCDATDTTMVTANNASANYFMGRPDGFASLADAVFVVAMLREAGTVTVVSGGNGSEPVTWDAPAGISARSVPMAVGQQSFFLARDGANVLSGAGLRDVTDSCVCGIYNFNAFVGSVPDGAPDELQSLGLASLTAGLHVSTCLPKPTLGTDPVAPSFTPYAAGSGTGSPPSVTGSSSYQAQPTPTPTPTPAPGSEPQPDGPTATIMTSSALPTATSPSDPDSPPSAPASPPSTPASPPSAPASSPSAPASSPSDEDSCNAGTGEGNYLGLCQFSCGFGYCPEEVCTCTSTGAPTSPLPPATGVLGVPVALENTSYIGLCSFACGRGYCPETACTTM